MADNHSGHRKRVREKLNPRRVEEMQPHELLEYLLFHTVRIRDTKDSAHHLIDTFSSVGGVLRAPLEELIEKGNLSEPAAVFLKLTYDLYDKYGGYVTDGGIYLDSPLMVDAFLRQTFKERRNPGILGIISDERLKVLNVFDSGFGVDGDIKKTAGALMKVRGNYSCNCKIYATMKLPGSMIPEEAIEYATKLIGLLDTAGDFLFMTDAGMTPLAEIIHQREYY